MLGFSKLLWLYFVEVVLLLLAEGNSNSDVTNKTLGARTSMMLEKMFNGYDKRLRPDFGGASCKINISLHVSSMVPIKEIDMEVTIVMFFRQHWTDSRLAYGPSLGIPKIKLLGNIVDQVWLPDTFFINDLSGAKPSKDFLFELTEDGRITYSHRKSLRLYCPMDLRKFPMDKKICEMDFESFSYDVRDVFYSWLNQDPVQIDNKVQIPQFMLMDWRLKFTLHEYTTGNFSRLSAVFRFKRQLGFYLLQEFIPTVLIVALSWVGFWIDERSVPARVSLGITTVLALTTLMFGIQASLPRVGHVKAIDVFLMGSFIFVFATLIEYAIICHLLSIHQTTSEVSDTFHQVFEGKQVELQKRRGNRKHDSLLSNFRSRFFGKRISDVNTGQASSVHQGQRCRIDQHCRKLFPMAYVLFLSIYFVVYYFADF
ncbi:gamma-aminobutyric acid receptor subunit beta-4-like [Porites lutea]|uniref:gamma-aminobutyric acid receptor subunit beta-4-like n=1 Tax=Porites lutea TaxID=51062 RepID=UPI003CC523E0